MESTATVTQAERENPFPVHLDRSSRSHRPSPDRVRVIQARLDGERELLGLALATFQAELSAAA